MKSFKRVLVMLLALAMVLGTLAACNKDKDKTENGGTNTTTPGTETQTPATEAPVDSSELTDGDTKLIIWAWNEEFKGYVEDYYLVDHPEAADKIEWVIVESNTYQEKLDQALASGGSDAPDMFLLEADYMKKYVSSDNTIPVGKLGIGEADYTANQYAYTYEVPKDERTGEVKALSWQATPGAFIYRRSLAEKYIGSGEPDAVQAAISDWDKFLDLARKINTESGGKTKIVSGIDDIYRPYLNNRTQAWVTDGALTIDPNMEGYLDYAKIFEQEGLTAGTTQWTEAWNANMGNDNVFGYFGCTWFLQWCIAGNTGGSAPGEGTYGDWGLVVGPQAYYWGGTWLAASKYCDNFKTVADIMRYFTINVDSMEKLSIGSMDYVNNKTAIANIIASGKTFDLIANQEHYKMFAEIAPLIDVSTMTGYDQDINRVFQEQVTAYSKGEKDKDKAIADFKAAVADLFADITVE